MLIAGEASGDLLAAELVGALQRQLSEAPYPPQFFGAGGGRMAAAGVELAFDLTAHSLIGLFEALKNYRKFKRLFDQLFQLACERQPDAIIGVDFSGFNRRFAQAISRHVRARRGPFNNWNPKIIQYVSPQVWASRPGRAHSLARDIDLLLSIFPFEKPWYARRVPRLRVEFVGHPMVDRFMAAQSRCAPPLIHPESERNWEADRSETPARHDPGSSGGSPSRRTIGTAEQGVSTVLLLPGSRAAELHRHLPVMLDAARVIRKARPDLPFLMVLPDENLKRLADQTSALLPGLRTQVGGLARALAQAEVAISKSGTITLECAFFGVPTVVIYRTSWSTYQAARRVITVKYLAIANLLASDLIYPELIQHEATPDNIARAVLDLLGDQVRRARIRGRLAQVIQSLGGPGASRRAAAAIVSLLGP